MAQVAASRCACKQGARIAIPQRQRQGGMQKAGPGAGRRLGAGVIRAIFTMARFGPFSPQPQGAGCWPTALPHHRYGGAFMAVFPTRVPCHATMVYVRSEAAPLSRRSVWTSRVRINEGRHGRHNYTQRTCLSHPQSIVMTFGPLFSLSVLPSQHLSNTN